MKQFKLATLAIPLFTTFTLFTTTAFAATNLTNTPNGVINTTWTKAQSPYIISGNIYYRFGSLTVEPGTIVKFASATSSLTIHADIILNINGSAEEPVYFTSIKDDSIGGDTNGDGSATSPAPGDWGYLSLGSGAVNNSMSINYLKISYGGGKGYYTSGISPAFVLNFNWYSNFQRRTYYVKNIEVSNSKTGMYFYTGGNHKVYLSDSSFRDNQDYAIYKEPDQLYAIPGYLIAQNNWWGSVDGPYHPVLNPTGTSSAKLSNNLTDFTPWLTEPPAWTQTQQGCTENCNSNVLFLPGLEASRLYRPDYNGGTDQLWEPNANSDAKDLFLTDSGQSARNDIYTKDVIGEAYGFLNIYKSFITDMDEMKSSSLINDWGAAPYDWRLSLDNILNYGNQLPDGRLYYSGDLAATSSPFVIQELKRLADTSKTGKVTIIAHSNGGLVAKALIQKLGDTEAANLIDKVIFVAVPQTGTPHAIGALLHGFKQGIPEFKPLMLKEETARALAEDMPSAYNLLPSEKYFSDTQTPVATFDNSQVLSDAFTQYGSFLNTPAELNSFLLGEEGRAKSLQDDLNTPNVLNSNLLNASQVVRQSLDSWTPPAGIEVIQIAGWGIDTLASIEYYQKRDSDNDYSWGYNPKLTEDGDGTVVVPSALAMSTSTPNVKRYWVDLKKYSKGLTAGRNHRDILEVSNLRSFIQNIITQSSNVLPEYILTESPPPSSEKKLRFFLHSPLTLNLYDDQGRHTGISSTGIIEQQIPGTDYREFGEVKYISTAASTTRLEMNGLATGTFTLGIEEVSGGQVATSTTFMDVPVTASTTVTMEITFPDISSISNLKVDSNGDGEADFQLKPGGIVSDIIPPVTTASLTGALGRNGWHTSDVAVALSAEDNPDGAGVKLTEYSLDNGATWNTYSTSSPITLSTEGIHTLLYSSTDFFNNKENTASTTIKIDKTAPEAMVTFDPATQKLKIVGIDNLSATVVSTTATSSVITDEAGNMLEIIFSKLKQEKHEIKLEISELRYNNLPIGEIPKTELKYEWSVDKTDKVKELEEKVTVGKLKTEGHYDTKKNVTKIKIDNDDGNKKKNQEVLPGIVIINLNIDNKGKILINF